MGDRVDMQLDLSAFHDMIERAGDYGRPAVARSLNQFVNSMVRIVAGRLPANQRTLKQSISAIRSDADNLVARVGSPVPWARITHYGGTIRPNPSPGPDLIRRRVFGSKPIKYLTIPLTGRGGAEKGSRARDYIGLFPWKHPVTKNIFLAQAVSSSLETRKSGFAGRNNQKVETGRTGDKKRGLRLLFMLVPKVTVKAHPYMYFDASDRERLARVMTKELTAAIRKNEGGGLS